MMELPFLLGIFGMFLVLVAFVLDEFVRSFNQNTLVYNLINILGSGLLMYYAFSIHSWPFIILNAVWLIVAIVKLEGIMAGKR